VASPRACRWPAVAGPVDYHLDPVQHARPVRGQHRGFSHALGTLSGSTGALAFDPDDWSTA
jgi:polyisoprenoid-binding protein YceI